MGWSRVLTKDFILFCKLVQPSPSSSNCPLRAIAIILATLAIARILACHPHHHRHCPLCHHCHCLLANLVTISIALPPSPSLPLATLIAATVVAAAIALVVAHPAPSLPSPLLLPPSPLPSSLLATLVAITIALFVASAFTPPPPSLPLCRLRWGRGGQYQSGAQSYFGRHRRCHHHCYCLCHPRNRPGGAGPTMRGIPTPGRQLALMWRSCCQRSCSRRHPPC
jgi:hypothetical protein